MLRNRVIRMVTISTLLLITGALLLYSRWPKGFVAFMQVGPDQVQLSAYMTYEFNTLNHPSGIWATMMRFSNPYPSPHPPSASPVLFIADSGNHVIRRFYQGALTTVAGLIGTEGYVDGSTTDARFSYPIGLSAKVFQVDNPPPPGGVFPYWRTQINLFVDDGKNFVIRKICSLGNALSDDCPSQIVQTACGSVQGFVDGPSTSACFSVVAGLTGDSNGTYYYVADAGNHAIRFWDGSNVSTFAGTGNLGYVDGYRTSAQFNVPGRITEDSSGNVYVADIGNNCIRKIDTSGNVSTLAGAGPSMPGYADGQGTSACFYRPTSIVFNPQDNLLYVADSHNHCIRRIDMAGNVSTYAGSGVAGLVNGHVSQAQFNMPTDITILNGIMYVSDSNNNSIRLIDMSNGQVSTLIN